MPFGRRAIEVSSQEVQVRGWPSPPQSQGDGTQGEVITGGFVFNGQVVQLRSGEHHSSGEHRDNGEYLATLYGRFENQQRYSLVAAVSADGWNWTIHSIIARPECSLPGEEGPCEAALARLEDGRLLCVFRTDGNFENVYEPQSPLSACPYGLTTSCDEGVTWSTPVPISQPGTQQQAFGLEELQLEELPARPGAENPGSVQPSLAGRCNSPPLWWRPGLFLWYKLTPLNQSGKN